MQVDLAGLVAFVTGGTGTTLCRAFADNGAAVVVADIDADGARALAATLPDALGIFMDVRDTASIEAAVAATVARWGRLDILINNAGVNTMAHRVHIDAFPTEEWDRIVRIDLDGLFLVSRSALRPMLARGAGRCINIASVAGLVPLRLQSPFVAAKAGVVNLTKSMALELGLSRLRIVRHIVLVPALRAIYPALGSQFVLQLLGSSLVSAIAAEELTAVGNNVMMQTFRNFEVFLVVGAIYFGLVQVFPAFFDATYRRLFRWPV
jgi:NAD(P)-dependent dehydrogenase (short-subunit alcohol dehydrogenase family)